MLINLYRITRIKFSYVIEIELFDEEVFQSKRISIMSSKSLAQITTYFLLLGILIEQRIAFLKSVFLSISNEKSAFTRPEIYRIF